MIRSTLPRAGRVGAVLAGVAALAFLSLGLPRGNAGARAAELQAPAPAPGAAVQTATFSGGCFWGVQGVFQHVAGVRGAVSGYAGGERATADYETVSGGASGHAESVQVTYDPAQVSYGRLLQIFFGVALDPTQVGGQGPDWGPQYRSVVWTSDPEQARVARAYIAQLEAAHVFAAPIATRVDPLPGFFPAEAYHQDYLTRHPNNPYIAYNDIPKVQALARLFPDAYQATPVTVSKLASGS